MNEDAAVYALFTVGFTVVALCAVEVVHSYLRIRRLDREFCAYVDSVTKKE